MGYKIKKSGIYQTESQEQQDVLENLNGSLDSYFSNLEHYPSGVIITDERGVPVKYNQKAVDLLGGIPQYSAGQGWSMQFGLYVVDGSKLFPEEEFPLQHALRGETSAETELLQKNGQPQMDKWLSVSARPILAQEGTIAGAVLYIHDITPYKSVEIYYQKKLKQIETANNFQHQITEISNDPLKILNTLVTLVVEAVGDGSTAALLTLPADKLRVLASYHSKPSARKILYASLVSQEFGLVTGVNHVIQTGEPLLIPEVDQERLTNITLPGFQKYVREIGVRSFMVVPIKGRNRVLGTLSVVRDRGSSPYTSDDQSFIMDMALRAGMAIDNNFLVSLLRKESSVRQSAEEALEWSEARFQSIFNSTAYGIKLLDLDGKILETNPAFQQMIGYDENELKGNPLVNFWYPDDAKKLAVLLDKLKANASKDIQLEHRLRSKDGSVVWVNVTFTGVRKNGDDGSLAFIVAITDNITARKQLEAEMSRMESRLQSHVELERLRLAQELHDGPLQDLYSAIYAIEGWQNTGESRNSDKLTDLKLDLLKVVQGLRNTAKDLRPPALADFGLEKAIRSHAEEFHENHPGINIHLDLAHDGKIIPEDIRLILFRIYQHSMANILRHAEACDINVKFSFDAEEARLEIQDNGSGFVVPTNWMDLVRQGHYGLAGAVERVSLLDGNFSVDSTPGEGTTVRVTIPIANIPENPILRPIEGRSWKL